MKFVHIADMHFDSPFTNLSDKDGLGNLRRLDQRKVFRKVIDYIRDNQIEALFISGDLYESQCIRESTIKYINDLFKEIPETLVFIAPGNHDPNTKNSYYHNFEWNENVKIFDSKIERKEFSDVDIYGFGFDEYYCSDCGLDDLEIKNKDKINILVIHANLDGTQNDLKPYNPISRKILEDKGFDYVALGHIHKGNYDTETKIIYPGSTVSIGFDELGDHGMIVGNIEKNSLETKFIKLDETEFKVVNIDVTYLNSVEDIVEKINLINFKQNELYEINLIGKRNFEINELNLYKMNLNDKIIKIKNNTKINFDLEKISNESTLRGIFAKEMLNKLEVANTEEEIKIIEDAIEYGMEVLE